MANIKRIERPDWGQLINQNCRCGSCTVDWNNLIHWFAAEVKPMNKLIEDATPVYGRDDGQSSFWSLFSGRESTHRAYLIDVRPIKQESAEDVLRDIISKWDDSEAGDHTDMVCIGRDSYDRAKAALDRSSDE